jgi:hypothetical protein
MRNFGSSAGEVDLGSHLAAMVLAQLEGEARPR